MALLRVLLLASLPCLGLTQEERLLIVYPAAPHPQNNLLPQSNEIEDSYTKVSSSKKEATKKPVMRTKSMSSVSTSYSVSSSVSSSQSSRRIDIGVGKPVKEREGVGRVGKVNKERMRDFYSRRRGEARKLLLIPPTRCCNIFATAIFANSRALTRQTTLFGFKTLTYKLISRRPRSSSQTRRSSSIQSMPAPAFNRCENIAQNARSIFNVRILHKIMSIEIYKLRALDILKEKMKIFMLISKEVAVPLISMAAPQWF